MPRTRLYTSNAERQAAYRARLAERRALADSEQLVDGVVEREAALAAASRLAKAAEQRTARAERQAAEARDRYTAMVGTRLERVAGTRPAGSRIAWLTSSPSPYNGWPSWRPPSPSCSTAWHPQRRGATCRAPLVPTGRPGAPRNGTEDADDGGVVVRNDGEGGAFHERRTTIDSIFGVSHLSGNIGHRRSVLGSWTRRRR